MCAGVSRTFFARAAIPLGVARTPPLDMQHLPVVVQRIAGDRSNEELSEDLDTIVSRLREFERAGTQVVTIVDLSKAGGSSPVQRRLQAEWVSKNEVLLRRTTIATAFVAPSSLVAGALTAIFWLKPPPGRYAVFVRLADAIDWIVREAEVGGLSPQPGLRERIQVSEGQRRAS